VFDHMKYILLVCVGQTEVDVSGSMRTLNNLIWVYRGKG